MIPKLQTLRPKPSTSSSSNADTHPAFACIQSLAGGLLLYSTLTNLVHPTPSPYTPHPTPYPYNVHPTPYTLHSTPVTLHPTPSTLNLTLCTLHFTPNPLHPTTYTLHPAPYNLQLQTHTSTLHPKL